MKAGVAKLKIQFFLDGEIALGPGKVDLLDAVEQTGSISAAARQLGMSYRRAWLLIDTMNQCFRESLVVTSTGGRAGGGASVTPFGKKVALQYRNMQQRASEALAADVAKMERLLRR